MKIRVVFAGVLSSLSLLSFGPLMYSAQGASVSIAVRNAVSSPDYDLTDTYGVDDWAYWDHNTNPAPGTPGNRKDLDEADQLIGDITTVGGSGLRGQITAGPDYVFAYTDGTNPVSGTVSNVFGMFNQTLVTTNVGVQTTVASPVAGTYRIYVWVNGSRAKGKLTATIGGASDTDTSFDYPNTLKSPGVVFTVTVTADAVGDPVTLEWVQTFSHGDFSRVTLAAVAVYTPPLPEVTTSTGPAVAGASSVTLRGVLTTGDSADAYLCWGTSDGGTVNTGQWQFVASAGTVSDDQVFSTVASSLSEGVTYRYRAFVSNDVASAWSDAVAFSFSNVVVDTEATIRGGTNAGTDQNEASAGYIMTKYNANLDFSRKSYFQFDLSEVTVNTNYTAAFTIDFVSAYPHAVTLWALDQDYPGLAADVTWNGAQANDTDSNTLETAGGATATAITNGVLIPADAPYTFTIPQVENYIFNDRLTLVLTGVDDAGNFDAGLRVTRQDARLGVFVQPPQARGTLFKFY